ncbi:MAG: prolipoprotein diacylglyceryl transferase [Firmicutes bacterium]|nr:prolipoprotein diacylglyceryl transferase [Bacillota bacterium]
MRPILWKIGPLHIYSYGFFLALAFLSGTWLTARQAKKQGINQEKVLDLALLACAAALIGARIVFVLLELPYYRLNPGEIFQLGAGGLSLHGGLIGGVLAGLIYCLRQGIDPWEMIDIVAPVIALGTAIARIGCLLNGCCYGYVTDLAIGIPVAFGDPSPRHPTQLYEAILSLGLFYYLYRQRKHARFTGYLGFMYVIMYSVIRSFVEIFRESRYLFGPIKIAQAFSFLLIAASLISIFFLERRHRRDKLTETAK